jgi:hypothetical protein
MKTDKINEQRFIKIIKQAFDRHLDATDNPEIKYLIELPMTREEYDMFMNIIHSKEN